VAAEVIPVFYEVPALYASIKIKKQCKTRKIPGSYLLKEV